MNTTISSITIRRNRRGFSPIDAERARVRALPSVRMLAGRCGLPIATALLTAEIIGLYTGGER
jgi:hypothetical protein